MTDSPSTPARSGAVTRRAAIKGLAATAGLAAIPGALAACSSSTGSAATGSASSTGTASSSAGSISFGSNYSDPAPKQAFASLVSGAQKSTGVQVSINTVDHNTFQDDITSYLQGTPNDLATWFAGYRMQFFAAQGLLEPIDDVWAKIGGNFDAATTSLCKGLDGHYYFVPIYNYPWVVFYNKSTFASKGYTVPTTWDQMIALCKTMKKDGLIPFAFADKDLWPALGTFDILNLRVNGYDYHISLMHNEAHWTDPQVTAVFDQWRELVPYLQTGANGRHLGRRLQDAGVQAGRDDVPGHEPDRRQLRQRQREPRATWTSSCTRRSTRRTARTTWTLPWTDSSCPPRPRTRPRRRRSWSTSAPARRNRRT